MSRNSSSRATATLYRGRNALLAEAAFGACPETAAAELPTPTDALDFWLRAVILAGQGHYAAARTELRRARLRARDPIVCSLVDSTAASLLRQLGWHMRAAQLDGRAVALVLPADRNRVGAAGDVDGIRGSSAEVVCDALTGLAADALGAARPALAARLLHRCRTHVEQVPDAWRPAIRWHWVAAETALAAPGAGLISEPAPVHAEAALALAERAPSVRHRVKSRLLVAAAAAAAGQLDRARTEVDLVTSQCRELGLLPLRWAAAMLRSSLDPAGDGASEASGCALTLAARGGRLCSAAGLAARP